MSTAATGAISALGAGLAAPSDCLAQHVSATWIGLGGSKSWTNDANWNTNSYPTGTSVGNSLPGDANYDGQVNILDLKIFANHFDQPGTWMTGDFNGDGFVDDSDLSILAQNWQLGTGGTSVGAYFTSISAGAVVSLGGSTITLSTLELSDPLYTTLTSGTIVLLGPAIIHADGNNFDLPEKVIPSFGTLTSTNSRPGNVLGGVGSLALSLVGFSGLTKTGDTHLEIDSPQFFSGTVSVIASGENNEPGGKIITTVGDSAFGASGNSIVLNSGSIQVSSTDWGTAGAPVTRTVNIGSLGGSIYWVGATGRNINFLGDITGNGTLNLNGYFALGTTSFATIRSNNSLTGTLNISGGTVVLQDNGAFVNSPVIRNSGTLVLDNSTSGANSIDRLSDTASITMRGAALNFKAGTTNYQESIGTTILDGGLSVITVDPGSGQASVSLGTFGTRGVGTGMLASNNAAGLFVRGTNLGSTPGPGVATVRLNNGTSLLIGAGGGAPGIIPFAYGNTNIAATESSSTGLLTYDVNGITPLPISSYSADFTTSNGNTYVKIQSSTSLSTTANVNALVLAAPDNFEVPNGNSALTLTGGTINVNSGVVLSANAGFFDNGGPGVGSINTLPGNVISTRLNFGSKEAVFLTPSALSIAGVISGSGGLTKIGGRTLQLAGANTYTGKTILTGFNRFSNAVPDNVTSSFDNPYGRDPSAIILYGGNASSSGTGFAELGASVAGGVIFGRNLDIRGDQVLLRSFGTGTVTWGSGTLSTITINDPNTVLTFLSSKSLAHQVVNAGINGIGTVVIGAVDPNPQISGDPEETWVDLLNAGNFQGNLVLAGGTIGLGNDAAMGTGTVQVSGDTLMTALNGPRVISNKFVVYGASLGIGTNGTANVYPFTITGEINGRGGDYLANIGSTTSGVLQPFATFSGALTGGGLTKTGLGTLTLSGNNTFTGVLNVGNGSLAGGMVILQSDTATGSTLGPTGVDYGTDGTQNTLEIDGLGAGSHTSGLNVGNETLYLRGIGMPNGTTNFGALYSGTGTNTWQGVVRPAATYDNVGSAGVSASPAKQIGAIGVAAGSTLTLGNGIEVADLGGFNGTTTVFLATPPNGGIGIRKYGQGALLVGSHTNLSANGTSQFNNAIYATGSLDIQGGTIAILSGTGISTISNGKSVVDVATLNFSGTASTPTAALDLADNGLIIDYPDAASTPISTIRSYLRAGYNGGSWNGTGITSSSAFSSPSNGETGRTGLGYAEATDVGLNSLFGEPINGKAVVVRYTYMADANFDGQVDATDLSILAQNWLLPGDWLHGDFNYDTQVNILDLQILAQNWLAGASAPLSTSLLAPALGDARLSGSPAAPPTSAAFIPEPDWSGLYGLLAVFTAVSLPRLRRRRKTPKNTTRPPESLVTAD